MNYRRSNRIKRKKSKLKKVLPLFFVFLSFGLLTYFLFFSDFFTFKKIIISGNAKVSQEDLLMVVQKETQSKKFQIIDNSLLLFDSRAIEHDILSSFSLISNVEISKTLPGTIKVVVIERIGRVIFCDFFEQNILGKCFVVDEKGVLFEEFLQDGQLLPRIRNSAHKEDLILGNKIIEEDLLTIILNFYLGLESLHVQLEEYLIVSDNRVNVITKDGWEIYFNPKESIDWQLTKLKAVLDEGISLEERKELEYIELRFGNTAPFKKKD